jgi:hypothetical protein
VAARLKTIADIAIVWIDGLIEKPMACEFQISAQPLSSPRLCVKVSTSNHRRVGEVSRRLLLSLWETENRLSATQSRKERT